MSPSLVLRLVDPLDLERLEETLHRRVDTHGAIQSSY
jgi:hypothetical protein